VELVAAKQNSTIVGVGSLPQIITTYTQQTPPNEAQKEATSIGSSKKNLTASLSIGETEMQSRFVAS
jgi:hypothetical protein